MMATITKEKCLFDCSFENNFDLRCLFSRKSRHLFVRTPQYCVCLVFCIDSDLTLCIICGTGHRMSFPFAFWKKHAVLNCIFTYEWMKYVKLKHEFPCELNPIFLWEMWNAMECCYCVVSTFMTCLIAIRSCQIYLEISLKHLQMLCSFICFG